MTKWSSLASMALGACGVLAGASVSFGDTDLYLANYAGGVITQANALSPGSSSNGGVANSGVQFQVDSTQVPVGSAVEITQLGLFAGISPSDFTGSGVLDYAHTLMLQGPNLPANSSDYTNSPSISLTIPAGSPVDSNGFAFLPLVTPIVLVPGDYYALTSSFVKGQTTDPYFAPSSNYTQGGPSPEISQSSIFINQQGRTNLTTGTFFTTGSGFFGANLKFAVVSAVPEPTSGAIIFGAASLLTRRRNRVSRTSVV